MPIIKTIIAFIILAICASLLYLVGKTMLTGPENSEGAYSWGFWIATYMLVVIAGWPIWKFVKALSED